MATKLAQLKDPARFAKVQMEFDLHFDHSAIDEFLEQLDSATKASLKKIANEDKELSEEQFENPDDMQLYRDHLGDRADDAQRAKDLGDQLSIIALFKSVEAMSIRILKQKKPALNGRRDLYQFSRLKKSLVV